MKKITEMSSRQRVVRTLDHLEPDRVPFDCSFGYQSLVQLREYLGLGHLEIPLPGNPSLAVRPPIELIQELKIDLLYISLNRSSAAPDFEFGMERFTDDWGVEYRKVENPTGISYEVSKHPLANAVIEDLEDYNWPDPFELSLVAGLEEKVRKLHDETELAIVGRF